MRVARSWPTAPAILLYAVAKWLCQNSAIFSSSGRCEWIMRNSQRCRASLISVLAENGWPDGGGDADVFGQADLRVVIGRQRLVVEQPIDDRVDRHAGPGGELRRTGAKPHTPKNVFEHTNPSSPRGSERASGL